MSNGLKTQIPDWNGPHHHIVASRNGLFLVHHGGYRLLTEGYFFGVTLRDEAIYAFKTVSQPEARARADSGSIVRYDFRGGVLGDPEILIEGLDYNCHQIDFFDGSLWVVDSAGQRVLEYDQHWRCVGAHQVAPAAERGGPGDAHINSFLGLGDRIYLMFHNGPRESPSEIVEFNRDLREIGRTVLSSSACHDLVRLEDGRWLYCESRKGQLAHAGGAAVKIDELFTRGLAVGAEEIAVGSSLYGARLSRSLLPGFVTFLDRAYNRVARVYLPAAPTQIRRLDGADLSLSRPR